MTALERVHVSAKIASGVALLLLAVTPIIASAQTNIAATTDAACVQFCAQQKKQGHTCPNPTTVCKTATVTGICMPDGCKAQSADGKGVDAGLGQLTQLLGQLMGKLMQGGSGSGSGSGSATPATSATTGTGAGCTSYYQSSVPSSDPCAYYVPNSSCLSSTQILGSITVTVNSSATPGGGTSNGQLSADVSTGPAPLTVNFTASGAGTLAYGDGQSLSISSANTAAHTYTSAGTFIATLSTASQCSSASTGGSNLTSSGDLLSALGGSSGTTDIGSLLSQSTDQSLNTISNLSGNTNTNTNVSSGGGATSSATTTATVQLLPNLGSGAQGNIQVQQNGATIVANTVDTTGNTAVAGFYGADTVSGSQQPQGLVAQLCQTRPWAGSFFSYVIPPSFFDGLCQWQGYQVGVPQVAQSAPQTVTLTQTKVPAKTATTSQSAATAVPPKVQIWAVPASVPLGARTSILWSAQGVNNCTETSPDGSFTSNTLQGNAATVPLTGPTTYSISCQAPDGTPVTGYVTVNIAL